MASFQPLCHYAAWALVMLLFTPVAAVRESIDDYSQLAQDLAVEYKETAGELLVVPTLNCDLSKEWEQKWEKAMEEVEDSHKGKDLELARSKLQNQLRKERIEAYKSHHTDCNWTETWTDWSCSASCGGGVSIKRLLSRRVTVPQDDCGMGRECPKECEGSTCTEWASQPCAEEVCPSDCSVVDLGNNITEDGASVGWQGGEGCVYQFWRVKYGKKSTELTLLAETSPQREGADPSALDLHASYNYKVALDRQPRHSRLVLGFRSCNKPPAKAPAQTQNVAKVCSFEAAGLTPFEAGAQSRSLSTTEQRTLSQFRADYRNDHLGRTTKSHWSEKSPGVTFEGDTLEPTEPAYDLSVTMVRFLNRPRLTADTADGVRLHVSDSGYRSNNKWTGQHVFVRRVLGKKKQVCEPELLPKCEDGAKVPCVGEDLKLSNFPAGSRMQAQVSAVNSDGHIVRTEMEWVTISGKAGTECPVEYWEASGKEMEEETPAPDRECRLDAPPVPACRTRRTVRARMATAASWAW